MNESLAKQLHNIIVGGKIQLRCEMDTTMNLIEDKLKKIIEENQNQKTPNNT